MTDANIISIAITLFAIAAGSLFNNLRISDSATHNGQRFDDLNKRFDDINRKLDRIADTLTAIIGDHESRIRMIEQRPR